MSFGNIWSDESRYIVIGVKPKQDGAKETPGIETHVDGADLVQALDGFVHPCPRFHYAQVELNGCQYGVIEIKAERSIGPFFATKDVGGGEGSVEPLLRKNALYCRRDSRNVEASPGEQAAIWSWFHNGQSLPAAQYPSEQIWKQLVEITQLTNQGCNYILVLALRETAKNPVLAHLSSIDWRLVVDLDSASQLSGALKYCHATLSVRRAVHLLTPEEKILGNTSRSTSWYFANGFQANIDPVEELAFRGWVTKFWKSTSRIIENMASECNGPVSIIALCEHSNRVSHVRKLLEEMLSNFGERASCVAITSNPNEWRTLEQDDIATLVEMNIRDFLDGLSAQARILELGTEHVVQFPGPKGVPKDVAGENVAYLEEDLSLVHLATGLLSPDGVEPICNFLRGGQITWFELGLQADVQRDKTQEILQIVESDLAQRRSTRVNLYHEPGAGGSTIARRVLWMLHQKYPAVVLRRCVALETAERIAWIYELTGQSVLILREGAEIPEREAEDITTILASKQLPFVLLQVLRRYNFPTSRPRNVFVSSKLTPSETERFRASLRHESPDRRNYIDQVANGPNSGRTAFLFGLAAFDTKFTGLKSYVQNHLNNVPETQVKVLQYLAMAYSYGQQSISPSHFTNLLQLSPNGVVQFERILCDEARGLLIKNDEGRWRPMHQLVSDMIIELTLSVDTNDTRLWNVQLGTLARDFIDFCKSTNPVIPADLETVLTQLFVRRNDAELLSNTSVGESKFSRLIIDLPNPDARLRVFEHLVDCFPENPHFWAHLGRYFSIERKDFPKAEEAINHAIDLSEDDYVLHHMKGMVLRNLTYQMIDERLPLELVVTTTKRASDSFQKARYLAPHDDYGYISDAQMVLRLLDYARGQNNAVLTLANENVDPWLREAFGYVESLLNDVSELRRGEAPSELEEKCRADLDILYGAPEQALQRWDQLLQRKTSDGQLLVYAPPIRRQIVWLQLARCDRRWDQMSTKHLQRSLDLLEENIQQEPNDDRNIRLWLQGARFLPSPPSLSLTADNVATWRMRGESLDSIYYLYVLKVLEALDGSAIAANDAQRNIELCKAKAGFRRDRTYSFEWLGKGSGLRRLVRHDQLGSRDDATSFWSNTAPLLRIEGVVSRIHAPQSGEIELRWNMKAFFVPATAGMSYGRDENRQVSFFLGFSYEGLRAWAVQPVDSSSGD